MGYTRDRPLHLDTVNDNIKGTICEATQQARLDHEILGIC